MAASLLNSRRAVDTSIYVVRAFVRLREASTAHAELGKLKEIERKLSDHDENLKDMFGMLQRILAPPRVKNRQIGFRVPLARTRSLGST